MHIHKNAKETDLDTLYTSLLIDEYKSEHFKKIDFRIMQNNHFEADQQSGKT